MITASQQIAYFAAACGAAYLLVGFVRLIVTRFGVLDIPNERSSHLTPTPRGGGAAIIIVTLCAVAIAVATDSPFQRIGTAWIVGGGIVGTVGIVDDFHHLPARIRLAAHGLAAALILVAMGGLPPLPTPVGTVYLGLAGWVVGWLAVVWFINLFNFMDGIDGLAAMQSLFVGLAGAASIGTVGGTESLRLPLLALAGSSAGFLIWNLPPAKIFMGDAGSGFIGFSLATVAYESARHTPISLWFWLILNGLFITDSTVTLISRLIRRQRVYLAHRSHAYQRLARRWGSHRTVTLIYAAINIAWCLPWAFATMHAPARGPIYAAAEFLPLVLFTVSAGAGKPDAD